MDTSRAAKAAAVLFAVLVLAFLLHAPSNAPVPAGDAPVQTATAAAHDPEPVPVPAAAAAEEGIAATPLSDDLPRDLPELGSASETYDGEFPLPPTAEPRTAGTDFIGLTEMRGMTLPVEEARWYYLGLVRAGMEDIGLCESGSACPVTVRFRHSLWDEKVEPVPGSTIGQQRVIAQKRDLIQATFTTRSTWNEILYVDYDNEVRGWRKTSDGWQSVGVFSHIPKAIPVGYPQDTMPALNEKAGRVYRKLLACTYVYDRCKG